MDECLSKSTLQCACRDDNEVDCQFWIAIHVFRHSEYSEFYTENTLVKLINGNVGVGKKCNNSITKDPTCFLLLIS